MFCALKGAMDEIIVPVLIKTLNVTFCYKDPLNPYEEKLFSFLIDVRFLNIGDWVPWPVRFPGPTY